MERRTRAARIAMAVLLLALPAAVQAQEPAQGPPRAEARNRFWPVNESPRAIETAFVSAARVPVWGPDILGETMLPPGRRVWVTPRFADCVLDVRVTYLGGGEEMRMGVDACRVSAIVFGGDASAGGAKPRGGG